MSQDVATVRGLIGNLDSRVAHRFWVGGGEERRLGFGLRDRCERTARNEGEKIGCAS